MLLMLPKVSSPVCETPHFPGTGYPCQAQQTTASAHRLWLEEQFQNETKGLMTDEKNCTAVVLASQDCSAPRGF